MRTIEEIEDHLKQIDKNIFNEPWWSVPFHNHRTQSLLLMNIARNQEILNVLLDIRDLLAHKNNT